MSCGAIAVVEAFGGVGNAGFVQTFFTGRAIGVINAFPDHALVIVAHFVGGAGFMVGTIIGIDFASMAYANFVGRTGFVVRAPIRVGFTNMVDA